MNLTMDQSTKAVYEIIDGAIAIEGISEVLNSIKANNGCYKQLFVLIAEEVFKSQQENVYWGYAQYKHKSAYRGFKIHVPIDGDSVDELIGSLSLVRDLKNLGVNSKISLSELPGSQNGKDIVIYSDNLKWLSNLSEQTKHFILSSSTKKVEGEFCLKTVSGESRVFVRYCHFGDGDVLDFVTGKHTVAKRGINPLPSFMTEDDMPLLDYVLNGHLPQKAYEVSELLKRAETMEDVAAIVNPLILGWKNQKSNYATVFPFMGCDVLHHFVQTEYFVNPY